MGYQFPSDVKELVEQQMASGKYANEDDLLRDALNALSVEVDDLRAVEEALTDLEDGDEGVPLNEAFDIIRKKHGIPLNE